MQKVIRTEQFLKSTPIYSLKVKYM